MTITHRASLINPQGLLKTQEVQFFLANRFFSLTLTKQSQGKMKDGIHTSNTILCMAKAPARLQELAQMFTDLGLRRLQTEDKSDHPTG